MSDPRKLKRWRASVTNEVPLTGVIPPRQQPEALGGTMDPPPKRAQAETPCIYNSFTFTTPKRLTMAANEEQSTSLFSTLSSFFLPTAYAEEEQKEEAAEDTPAEEPEQESADDEEEEEEEEEEDPEDAPPIREKCEQTECQAAAKHFQACQQKVEAGQGWEGEDCVEEMFHMMHCVDTFACLASARVTMSSQELILSSSAAAGASIPATRTQTTPAIQLHDLATSSHVQAFKTITCAPNTLTWCQSHDSLGATPEASSPGKVVVRRPVAEWRLACCRIPEWPDLSLGASGLMLASWNAHYRSVTTLSFTSDSALLLSSSADASVHIFLVSRLIDCDASSPVGKPYGSLSDHTLGVSAVAIDVVPSGSFRPPGDFCPASLRLDKLSRVDSAERFVYVGSKQGDVYLIPLYNRPSQTGLVEAVNGHGPAAPPVKIENACISVGTPITCLALSFSASQLLIGTSAGDIHVHALPSHQQVRSIPAHAGPVSYLSTVSSPPDLVGRAGGAGDWPIMEIKNLERMRVTKSARESQEVSILAQPEARERLSLLRGAAGLERASAMATVGESVREDDTAALREEIRRLQGALDKAARINEKMWNGVVDLKLGATP
ncbi:ribosomal large subunit assembly and maintenance-related protein [Trichosporon asahii var. asahii CBS 8904]|uniref:Pre-rRNA-processing protein IPI3 n=1 Tax=Trichosporon asahii var. asahii (strain CBS 8904) TaxID=1220162 RepID=K1VIH9_TRIAC|nr:ribosomal large subunit assembly and maintenance-related protein [Trichosporon asahii var. asahii CBS 8904]